MGVIISLFIISAWGLHFFYCMYNESISLYNPFLYLHMLIQAYLFTGLFITSHDAMHGNVSGNKKLNNLIGSSCSFLFAGMSYKKLYKNHHRHHTLPGTDKDPDFCYSSDNFFIWWFVFLKRYVTVIQIIIMALIFNILKYYFGEWKVWIFLIIPVMLSTFQLFYFGTYRPHKRPHKHDMLPHNARTQKKNHLLAMISCYFFGYHSEHHNYPGIPWWKLYKTK